MFDISGVLGIVFNGKIVYERERERERENTRRYW